MTACAARGTPPVARPDSARLARRLTALSGADDTYWTFTEKDDRDFVHGLFHYPAMMVPRMQRVLIEECVRWDPTISTIYDPFVGSGTVMTEAMLAGKDFVGTDVNPLAVLICHAKAALFDADRILADLKRVLRRVESDPGRTVDIDFPGRDKWFEPAVLEGLSRLRRAILRCSTQDIRRFWWVVLAETTRLVSNSRTSTVKLHIRPRQEIENRQNDPIGLFHHTAHRSVNVLRAQQQLLAERQLLHEGSYVGNIDVRVADVRHPTGRQVDMLVTSPPYGDNHTTVTYGQAAYLPLQWVRRGDIDGDLPTSYFTNTAAIDSASLGGSVVNALADIEPLLDRSAGLRHTLDRLNHQPMDRRKRVAAFFRDFDSGLANMMDAVRPGGLMIWTVGDRSVGDERVPLAAILRQLIGDQADTVAVLKRTIPQSRKRMPMRNSITSTMGAETILVLRKNA